MTTQHFLLSAWHWHPAALAATAAAALAYVAAARKAETRRPKSEGRRSTAEPVRLADAPSSTHRWWFFALALILFLLTLVSPLGTLADGYLFSAHMLQHLLLLLVVPPLALLALPSTLDTRPSALRTPHSALRTVLCWLSGVGAMWFWHVPTLCNAATASPVIRSLQTVSLLVLGTLFWLPILARNARHRLSPPAGVLYLFTACVGCTLLGIIITFAPVSVCSIYMHPVDRLGILPLIRQDWGLTPSVDQQVGGLLMWVPACLIYLCSILSLLGHWFTADASQPQAAPPGTAPSADLQSA